MLQLERVFIVFNLSAVLNMFLLVEINAFIVKITITIQELQQ